MMSVIDLDLATLQGAAKSIAESGFVTTYSGSVTRHVSGLIGGCCVLLLARAPLARSLGRLGTSVPPEALLHATSKNSVFSA